MQSNFTQAWMKKTEFSLLGCGCQQELRRVQPETSDRLSHQAPTSAPNELHMPHQGLHKRASSGIYNCRQLRGIASKGLCLISEMVSVKILQT